MNVQARIEQEVRANLRKNSGKVVPAPEPEVELTCPIERRDAARAEAARLMRDPAGLFLEKKPTDSGLHWDDEN